MSIRFFSIVHRFLELLNQIDYYLLLAFRFLCILCCTAPGVSDVGDDIIGLFEHPVVAPGNGVVWVDGLDPFREHGIGVVVIFRFLAGHIGQHNSLVDLWIFLLQFLQLAMHIGIKLPLVPHIEHIHSVVGYQIHEHLS